jgi:hypothetical protein
MARLRRRYLLGLFVIGTNRTGRVPSVSVPVPARRRILSSGGVVPTGIAIKPLTQSIGHSVEALTDSILST